MAVTWTPCAKLADELGVTREAIWYHSHRYKNPEWFKVKRGSGHPTLMISSEWIRLIMIRRNIANVYYPLLEYFKDDEGALARAWAKKTGMHHSLMRQYLRQEIFKPTNALKTSGPFHKLQELHDELIG